MEEPSPAPPKDKTKSFFGSLRLKANLPTAITILVVVLAGFGIYEVAIHRSHELPPLESVDYMEKNCPHVVSININSKLLKQEQSGASIEFKKSGITAKKPTIKFTWQISKADKFCGIVGAWYGPKYVSLRPTSQTDHSGEYTDYSQKDAATPAGSMQEFFVYAQPTSK